MKVLLVDDEDQVREMLARVLQQTGHEVTEAQDGKRAIELFRSNPFDLVLTDLVMPQKDGVELISAIRRANVSVPIIAMSGGFRVDSLQSVASASAAGANEILYKPFDLADLKRAIETFRRET